MARLTDSWPDPVFWTAVEAGLPEALNDLAGIVGEAAELKAAWRMAMEDSLTAASLTAAPSLAEYQAWDALIDYVETHHLSYTRFDPRVKS